MKRLFWRGFCAMLVFLMVLNCWAEARDGSWIAAEGAHVLVLDENGDVWAWGSNQRGESVTAGEGLMRVPEPVKVFEGARAVACGQQFSMALTDGDALYMWGDNRLSQIPGLEAEQAAEPLLVMDAVASVDACDARGGLVTLDGRAYVWGDGEGMTLVFDGASQIAVGMDFVLILSQDGKVYFMGSGEYMPDGEEAVEPVKVLEGCAFVAASGQSAYAVTADGALYAWGANGTEGRLGLHVSDWVTEPQDTGLRNIVRVCPGLSASAAIGADGGFFIWGSVYSFVTHFDEDGEAVGSFVETELVHYGDSPIRMIENVKDAAFGDAFACVLLKDGTVCTWGSNDQGQIGDGTYTQTAVEACETDEEAEISIVENEQRIFPVYLRLPE